ncbi:MAG TPA: tail fiber protein [Terriglobia bacterium]|nr:tail fiber protein [Terriglobia bacterium]
MSTPFVGEIRVFGFNYAPQGWALCNGQLLPIAQNQALFSLLGTTYGGDGRTNFALPDLRGRTGIHVSPSAGYSQGQAGGSETVALTVNQIPSHTHTVSCSNAAATQLSPKGGVSAIDTTYNMYSNSADGAMAANAIGTAGASQPHPNLQPFLCVNFCIALQGIYPSRN